MISKFLYHKNKIYILFLFFFSIIINQYYGNRGAFPLDSFHFFDSGYRIQNGDVPFIDYWLVKGVLLDYIQAIFFYIFGLNWQSYVLHASSINALITISTFLVLKNFKLQTEYCFFYSLLLSILAYPSSGTPFIDHHSAFLSLLGIYSLLLAISNKRRIYWFLIPILLGFAFLSKQVPATYVILSVIFILFLYALTNRKFDCIKYSFISSFFFIFFILSFGKFQGIALSSFLDQYIFYPQTIGSERFKNLSLTFNNTVENFTLIYLTIVPLFYENFKKIFYEKNYAKHENFYIFLTLVFLTFSLVLHQLLTKNQIFIFFLIPILTAFSHISLNQSKLKFKKSICSVIILICLFATFKYHLRYNENRKFHELKNINFQLAIDAKKIHKKLSGLNWITPKFKDNPEKEINLINQIFSILKKDTRKKMVITNYPFFSVIFEEDLHAPSRVYTGDGTTHPLKDSDFTLNYKKMMDNLILKNNISVIYVIDKTDENVIFHYLDLYQHCYEKISLHSQLESYELKNCND
jgi:hypothetical protein